jgi:myo-inositol-1(or 4)-monophosphatase
VRRPSADELQGYLSAAESIVRESQTLVLSRSHLDLSQQTKRDGSPVTEVDFAIEDFIRSRLWSEFPGHGVIGEEREDTPSESGFYWVIDPIDGTRSFSHQIPLYGTLLSLRHGDKPIVGVMSLPGLSLLYTCAQGLGAYRNGKQIRLPEAEPGSSVESEIIAIGDRRQFVSCEQIAVFDRLMRSEMTVRTYCDCFGHALAIDGRVGAMVDYGVSIWDISATELLVQEAGGQLKYVGEPPSDRSVGSRCNVVFGKPQVVQWVLARIGETEI